MRRCLDGICRGFRTGRRAGRDGGIPLHDRDRMARRARLHDDRCGLAGYLHGRQDKASGRFLAVVWENLADPIITGRGEVGQPKLYAEIAEPRLWDGTQLCTAGWMGFPFLDLTASELRDTPSSPTKSRSDGRLMLKY